MDCFGINIDCDEKMKVIRKQHFTNFLKNDIFSGMRIPLLDLPYLEKPYIPTPILFSRFNMLNFNTDLMEDNSVITNCSTLKSLALNKKCSYILFPVELDSVSKTFYILHAEKEKRKLPQGYQRNLHISKRLEASLKEEVDNYRTFTCFHKTINDPQINLYYTHQIDLYDNQRNPIEVKALYYNGDQTKTTDQKLSECFKESQRIDSILQCKIGEVDKIIFGLHEGNEAEIIQMNIDELNVRNVGIKVQNGLARMKNNFKDFIKKYHKSMYAGKAVRIKNIETHTSNAWHFTSIDFEDLSKSSLSYLTFVNCF